MFENMLELDFVPILRRSLSPAPGWRVAAADEAAKQRRHGVLCWTGSSQTKHLFQYVSIQEIQEMLWNVMKCLQQVVILDLGIQLIRLILPKLQAQNLKLVEQRRPACQSWAVAGGGIQRTFTSLHGPPTFWRVVAWPHAATACCYGDFDGMVIHGMRLCASRSSRDPYGPYTSTNIK